MWTSMPKTSMNKYCYFLANKCDIWIPYNFLPMNPITSNIAVTKCFSQHEFRFSILSFYRAHYFGCKLILWNWCPAITHISLFSLHLQEVTKTFRCLNRVSMVDKAKYYFSQELRGITIFQIYHLITLEYVNGIYTIKLVHE